MTKKMNPLVGVYIKEAMKWQQEMQELRSIILDPGLSEEIKWGKPCYTYKGRNIVLIQGFKNYCALLFFKGYLLTDPYHLLIKTGKNTTIGRQIRFTGLSEIKEKKDILKNYIRKAIEQETKKQAFQSPKRRED